MLELSTIGIEKWGKHIYRIAVLGGTENPNPHIHIFRGDEDQPFTMFDFEISIVDILCKDEINLISQVDRVNNVMINNPTDCNWDGYAEIYHGFRRFLSRSSNSRYGHFMDNLDRAIYDWNRETDFLKTENGGNPLKEYLDANNLEVLTQYLKYFE